MLQRLRVTFNVNCSLAFADRAHTATAFVIECTSADLVVVEYFYLISGQILREYHERSAPENIVLSIDILVSLFQKLTRPATKDVQGIFGELFAIDLTLNPNEMVRAWRKESYDRFDFARQNLRLEIKTSASRQRKHQFSLEQCSPPAGVTGILLSIFVEQSGGGLSLSSLITRIERRLENSDLVLKLHDAIASALGVTLAQSLDQSFDEQLALSTVAFYDLRAIPAIRFDLPLGVSGVRFTSELTSLPTFNLNESLTAWPELAVLFGR